MTKEELRDWLAAAQARRETRLAFSIRSNLSDRQLRDLLDQLLPMAQERAVQLRQERCGDWHVTLRLRYRAGVRMADACHCGNASSLSPDEQTALARALAMVELARRDTPDPRTLARRLFKAARACAVYDNPAMGTAARGQVVSAVSALVSGRANCQGFSDAYYLLGTLAGLTVGYQAGLKDRVPHLFNTILLDGRCQAVDVTAGTFPAAEGKNPSISEKSLHKPGKICYTELDYPTLNDPER